MIMIINWPLNRNLHFILLLVMVVLRQLRVSFVLELIRTPLMRFVIFLLTTRLSLLMIN